MKRITKPAIITLLLLAVTAHARDKQPVHTLNKRCLIADYGGNKVCIMEKDGTIAWEMKAARPQDVWMLPNGNTLVCNWGGHGHVGKQPQIFEVTRDKNVVGELFDYRQFKTISGVCVLDIEGDPAKFEVLR